MYSREDPLTYTSLNSLFIRRSDLRADSDVVYTDDNRKFKKAEQTIGRPGVTDHNINDEYLRDAPNVRCWPCVFELREADTLPIAT